jgi:LPS export ABC transporter protein LptC
LRNTAAMVVLAVLAAATWVWSWRPEAPAAAVPAATDAAPLGYFVHGARVLGTNEQGQVVYRVNARRLDEQPDQGVLIFDGVSVEYQPMDATPWEISANGGSGPKDGSALELVGQVELKSLPDDGSTPVVITTERLKFSADTSRAETDEAVQIRVGDWRLDAVGLSTDLKDDTLRLESEVHGTFAPQ